ncbi:MAG: hypothetical protein ABI298_04290 [Acidimicrobiales bacterium]
MTAALTIRFSTDRDRAIDAIESVASGRGWCNVTPLVEEDVDPMKVNYFGLRFNKGVVVASYVTVAPKKGVEQLSSIGLLHSRGRLGHERINSLLAGAPFATKQDHNSRGLLLGVAPNAPASLILNVMCTLTEELCDFQFTGTWNLSHFVS